jgi:hypothetical protein
MNIVDSQNSIIFRTNEGYMFHLKVLVSQLALTTLRWHILVVLLNTN